MYGKCLKRLVYARASFKRLINNSQKFLRSCAGVVEVVWQTLSDLFYSDDDVTWIVAVGVDVFSQWRCSWTRFASTSGGLR